MTKIAYIGMAAKPYHQGHQCLVEMASKECNLVKLYISTGDRVREGEASIKGTAMQEIWAKYLLKIMPENVDVFFVNSPVRAIYEAIGVEDKGQDNEMGHVIYGDDNDVNKSYPSNNLQKYFPRLTSGLKLETKGFSRKDTVEISGTTMRKFLQLDLREDFISGLPEGVRVHGNEIWELLGGKKF